MKKYTNELYPLLSQFVVDYFINHPEIIEKDHLEKWAKYCAKEDSASYEYSGIYTESKYPGLLEDLMEQWFKANDIDYGRFFEETTRDYQWMDRTIPGTYAYVISCLLLDINKSV